MFDESISGRTLSISSFIVDDDLTKGNCRLFTPTGATSISDARLVPALQGLGALGPRASHEKVLAVLERNGLPAEAALAFLLRINVLREVREDNQLVVLSPSASIARKVSDYIGQRDAVVCRPISDVNDVGPCSMLLVIQDQYSHRYISDVYRAFENRSELIILHSYFVFRHFIIDGFYSPAMGLPDHFSGLHNLAGLERNPGFKPLSWADFFLSDPYALEAINVPTFPPSEIELSAALHLLCTRIRPFIAQGVAPLFPDDLSTVMEVNLDTGRVERHRGCHSNFSDVPRLIAGGRG